MGFRWKGAGIISLKQSLVLKGGETEKERQEKWGGKSCLDIVCGNVFGKEGCGGLLLIYTSLFRV